MCNVRRERTILYRTVLYLPDDQKRAKECNRGLALGRAVSIALQPIAALVPLKFGGTKRNDEPSAVPSH